MKLVQNLPDHTTVVLTCTGNATLLIWHGEGFSPAVAYKHIPNGNCGFRFQNLNGNRTRPSYGESITAPVPWVLV